MPTKELKKYKLLTLLSSQKITVMCLLLFMVITILGTLYQVAHGISEARDTFFTSWFILIKGVMPFPGGQLILWIFAINLLSSCFVRFKFKLNKIGIWFVHIGLLVLCFSSFYTYKYSIEGNLQISEGDTAKYAIVKGKWELAIWYIDNGNRIVTCYPMSPRKENDKYLLNKPKVSLSIEKYIENSEPVQGERKSTEYINVSNITDITKCTKKTTNMQSIPGMILSLSTNGSSPSTTKKVILYGGERFPTKLQINGTTVYLQLRAKTLRLPAKIKLVDVVQQMYKGTNIAKNYESNIIIYQDGVERKVRIFMNHPLSIDNFTFYQSSYGKDIDGREATLLTVVKNPGKYLPYIACIITGLGMIIHFMLTPLFSSIFKQTQTKRGKR